MLKALKKVFTVSVVVTTIFWAVGLAAFVPVANAATFASGDLIKASGAAVYYYGADGKRYVFPDEKTYKTWYADFSGVITITDSELAALPIGGNVTAKPGVKMIKITTDPKVYAVAADGSLRWITTEAIAVCLYGSAWAQNVNDLSDAFFAPPTYTVGADITSCSDFNVATTTAAATSINVNMGLGTSTPTAAGTLTAALAADSPVSTTLPAGATGVTVAKFNLSAGGAAITLNGLTVKRVGLGAVGDYAKVYLYEGSNKLSTGKTLNATTNEASFVNLNKSIASNATLVVSVVVDIDPAAAGSGLHQMEIAAASAIDSTASSVVGTFPVIGNSMTVSTVNVGSADVESNNAGYTRKVGETGVEIGNFTVTVNNIEDATFNGITLYNSGRDVASNVKLYRGSDLVATGTISGSYWVFTLTTPYSIAKGESASFTVKGDIGGRNADTIVLDVRYNADVQIKGKTYGFNLTIDGALGTDGNSYVEEEDASPSSNTTTIQAGQLTAAINGPSSTSVAKNSNDINLMNFSLTSLADIDVERATIQIGGNNLVAGDVDDLELVCGNVVVASWATVTVGTILAPGDNASTDIWSLKAGATTSCFVRIDITNTAAGNETIQATLKSLSAGPGTNWKFKNSSTGDTISDIVPSGNIAGNAMTVTAASLSIGLASSPATGLSFVKGASNADLVGFVFTAGNASDVKITSVKLTAYADDNQGGFAAGDKDHTSGAQNVISAVKIYDSANTTTPLTTAKSLTVGTGDITTTFDGLSWIIPKGTSKILLVKGDISTTAPLSGNNDNIAIVLAAAGNVVAEYGSGSAITPNLVNGNLTPTIVQTVKGTGVLTVNLSSDTPLISLVTSGSTGVSFTKVKFSSTNEAFTIKKLKVVNNVPGTDNNFAAVTISYTDAAGATQTASSAFSGGVATFNDLTAYVPVDGSSYITIKGNITTTGNGATNGAAPALAISFNGYFEAIGNSSGVVVYGTTTKAGDSDLGIGLLTAATNLKITNAAVDALWSAGECIYIDTVVDNLVGATDVRVTDCMQYSAGTAVVVGDADVGVAIIAATDLGITGGDATWAAGELAYVTAGVVADVQVGETRVLYGVAGNAMTVYESYPTVAFAADTPSGNLVPNLNTLVAKINVTAGSNQDITFVNGSSFKTELSDSSGAASTVTIKDAAGLTLCTGAFAATFDCTFGTNPFVVAAGTTKTLYVYVDTSLMTGAGDSIQAWLDDAGSLSWGINGIGAFDEASIIFRGGKFGGALVKP